MHKFEIPKTIEIPFDSLTPEQRHAIVLIAEGDGFQNPLVQIINESIDVCLNEIDILNSLFALPHEEGEPWPGANALALDGYYPLFLTPEEAIAASPTPDYSRENENTVGYHTHTIEGVDYYMPNGLGGAGSGIQFHGTYGVTSDTIEELEEEIENVVYDEQGNFVPSPVYTEGGNVVDPETFTPPAGELSGGTGWCCILNDCHSLTELQCHLSGGVYGGSGSTCGVSGETLDSSGSTIYYICDSEAESATPSEVISEDGIVYEDDNVRGAIAIGDSGSVIVTIIPDTPEGSTAEVYNLHQGPIPVPVEDTPPLYEILPLSRNQADEVIDLLESLLLELNLLKLHTDAISGKNSETMDEFFDRLSVAGAYSSIMKTITDIDQERYSFVFGSLMGIGDFHLNKIINKTACVPCESCDSTSIQEGSGIIGLALELWHNPTVLDSVVSSFLPKIIKDVHDLIDNDETNYCKAKKIVHNYTVGQSILKETENDPIFSKLVSEVFSTPQFKHKLLDIKNGVTRSTDTFFPEFAHIEKASNVSFEELLFAPYPEAGSPCYCFDCEEDEIALRHYQNDIFSSFKNSNTFTCDSGLSPTDFIQGPIGHPGGEGNIGNFGEPGPPGYCDYSDCGVDPLVLGACCLLNITCKSCIETTREQCISYAGEYMGDNTLCELSLCGECVSNEQCISQGKVCCDGVCEYPPCSECEVDSDCFGSDLCCNGGVCLYCPPPLCVPPCPPGFECCGDGQCCPVCCGNSCCNSLETCCDGNCCGAGTICCDGNCCPAGSLCCGGACCGEGLFVGPDGPEVSCCGDTCCNTSECCGDNCGCEDCCNDNECCGANETCCGNNECCNDYTEFCYGDKCCPRNADGTPASGQPVCADGDCPCPKVYDPCTGDLRQQYCCGTACSLHCCGDTPSDYPCCAYVPASHMYCEDDELIKPRRPMTGCPPDDGGGGGGPGCPCDCLEREIPLDGGGTVHTKCQGDMGANGVDDCQCSYYCGLRNEWLACTGNLCPPCIDPCENVCGAALWTPHCGVPHGGGVACATVVTTDCPVDCGDDEVACFNGGCLECSGSPPDCECVEEVCHCRECQDMCWDCGPGSNGCLSRCEDDLNSPCQDEFGECPCDIPDCNSPTPRNLNDDGVLGTNAQLTKEISIVPDPIEIVQADVNFQIINFTTNEKLKTIDPGEGPYSAFGGYSWYSSSGLLDSDRLGKPNYENAGSTTKIIKGSLTATVSSDGYIRDSGIISFVSGSNIKLDTNEANNIIRISVDDLYLTEMADIDDNIQPVNGSHLQHSGSAVTGGWKISPSDYPVGPQGPVIDELEDFGPDDVRIAYNENGTVGGTSDFEFVSAVPNRIGITGPVIFNDGITMSSSGGMLGNDMIEPTLKNNTESLKDYEEFYIGFFGFEDGNTQRISATGAAIPPNCSLYIYDAPPSGQAGLMTVYIENGAGFTFDECLFCNGCAAVGNTETILWAGGTAPTLSTGLDVLSFLTVDGGSTYYGFVGGMNFS